MRQFGKGNALPLKAISSFGRQLFLALKYVLTYCTSRLSGVRLIRSGSVWMRWDGGGACMHASGIVVGTPQTLC